MSAIWCWAHEFGQPETYTRSAGCGAATGDADSVATGTGGVGDAQRAHGRPGAGPDLGVAALAEQEQAAVAEGAAGSRQTPASGTLRSVMFWSRVSVRKPSPHRSARSQNSSISSARDVAERDVDRHRRQAGTALRPHAGAPAAGRRLGEDLGLVDAVDQLDRGDGRVRPRPAPRRRPPSTRRGSRRRPAGRPGTSAGPSPGPRSRRAPRTRRRAASTAASTSMRATNGASSTASCGALPRLPPAHTS